MNQDKGLQRFAKRTHWLQQTPSSNSKRDDFTHEHHQMVNSQTRFIAAEDGETLYSQQKKKKKRPGADCGLGHELTVKNTDLN